MEERGQEVIPVPDLPQPLSALTSLALLCLKKAFAGGELTRKLSPESDPSYAN